MNTQLAGHCRLSLFILISSLGLAALAEAPQLVSVPDPVLGQGAAGSGDSTVPILSPDGRYILFASTAQNLVPGTIAAPLPARFNVFLRDRTNATTTLVSRNLAGNTSESGDSLPAALSTDGRFALFESSANDLVPGDTNNASDIFLRDLTRGTTVLVSISTNLGVGNGASRSAVMTPDGRYVAFVSAANNLVPGDTNGIADVFIRDLQSGTTTLVSVGATSANRSSPSSSEAPLITPDGRYVAFYSTATNLVPGVASFSGNIFVRDLVGATTIWASADALAAVQAALGGTNAVAFNPVISDDGQFVAYEAVPAPRSADAAAGIVLRYQVPTARTELVHTNAHAPIGVYEEMCNLEMTPDGRFIAFVANTNSGPGITTCIQVWDANTGAATLVSGDQQGQVPPNSLCDWPALDASGRYVAFLSSGVNLVTNALRGDYHLYLRDRQTGAITLLDADTNGIGSLLSPAARPRLSANADWVAFEGPGLNLVDGGDIFVRNLRTDSTELISVREPALPSLSPSGLSSLTSFSVSADGHYLTFASEAANLVANDTNGLADVFVRDLASGINILVSASTNGLSASGSAWEPAISSDGRYVAFTSSADNLVAGDTNKAQDVFLRDLQSGTTTLVSMNSAGSGPGNGPSYSPCVSTGGRFVLFRSKATDLAAGTGATENLFVRDLQAGATYALTTLGVGSLPAAMTPDGRFVAYGDGSGGYSWYVYLWDTQAAACVYTNKLLYGASLFNLALTPDGRRIAYACGTGTLRYLYFADPVAKTNLLVESNAGSHKALRLSSDGRWLACIKTFATAYNTNQVYLFDLQARTNVVVSRGFEASGLANGPSDAPDLSAEGRWVAYRSAASNLVPGDSNSVPDVFLYDRLSGTTTLLSVSRMANMSANDRSTAPVFSADGQRVFFESWASDLTPQDYNRNADVFAFGLYSSAPIPLLRALITPNTSPNPGSWISWPAAAGKTYRVQFKNSLSDPAWQDLEGSVTVVGTQGYLKDLAPVASQKFYRIVCF